MRGKREKTITVDGRPVDLIDDGYRIRAEYKSHDGFTTFSACVVEYKHSDCPRDIIEATLEELFK